jgi:hypothetical protein
MKDISPTQYMPVLNKVVEVSKEPEISKQLGGGPLAMIDREEGSNKFKSIGIPTSNGFAPLLSVYFPPNLTVLNQVSPSSETEQK